MQPNVLLVVADTVRAKNCSAYGYHRETTPFLETFAEERATLYEQARAPAARSLDSHVSLLTGLHVEEHGVTRSVDKLAPGNTVFEDLADAGYATGVFSENSWLTDVDAGIKDAFDTVEGPRNVPFPDELDPTSFVVEHGQGAYAEFVRAALDSGTPHKVLLNGLSVKLGSDFPGLARLLPSSSTTPADQYVDLFLDWSAEREEPWAACVNLMDAHHPYLPKPDHDRWGDDTLRDLQADIEDVKWEFNGGKRQWWQRAALEALYDGCIRQLDSELERLVAALERRGELDDTLVVVLSDHGEGFGDPSEIRPNTYVASHSVAIHECLHHVPLVVQFPGQDEGRRVEDAASIVEFPRAVEAALDDDWDHDAFVPDGPVLATAHGLDEPVQERARRYCEDLWPFTATARAVWEGSGTDVTKYATWRDRAMTKRCRDAGVGWVESRDGNERVEAAFGTLREGDVRTGGEGFDELGDEQRQHLEDLGYV